MLSASHLEPFKQNVRNKCRKIAMTFENGLLDLYRLHYRKHNKKIEYKIE